MKSATLALGLLTLTYGISPATSLAAPAPVNWTPSLAAPAQGEYRDPMEILRIKLPANLSIDTLKILALELDNIDVTAMVSRNGNYAEFTPLQPLPWGTHTLRLVEYAADGGINEKAYWEFQVRRSSAFREVDYAANINLLASRRVADKNLVPPEPNEFTGQGSAVFQGRVADNDWEVTGQMDLIYTSEEQLTVNKQSLDMGSYLVSGRKQDNQFNLGQHTLAQSSLIMQGFNRRGLSASTRFDTLNSAATGFVMRPDIVIGFRQGLGLSDNTNRVSGMVWESQPLTNPEALYVAATYLNGEQTLPGATVGSIIDHQQGDAMSLLADSTVIDRRLRVRGEVAAAKVSIDYTDPLAVDLVDESSNAMSLLTTWTPTAVSGQTLFWNTGLEASKVDTFFASLANPSLPADKQLNRLFFNTDWSGISAQLSTAVETNNVDKLIERPVIETRVNQALLNYVFNQPIEETSWLNWVGTPSVTMQWRGMTQQQIEAAAAPIADMNLDTNILQLSNNFMHSTWTWGWMYGESAQTDHISVLEQLTYMRGLNANARIGEHLSIMPVVQQQTTQFSFDGSEADTQIISLTNQFLVQDSWNGSLMFNTAQIENTSLSTPQDSTTDTVSLQFTWNWILAKNNHPGFDVILSGSWQKLQDSITPVNDKETYQVFLSLAMKLPLSSAQ